MKEYTIPLAVKLESELPVEAWQTYIEKILKHHMPGSKVTRFRPKVQEIVVIDG